MSQLESDPKPAWNATLAREQFISSGMRSRGFLPEHDPLIGFSSNSEFVATTLEDAAVHVAAVG